MKVSVQASRETADAEAYTYSAELVLPDRTTIEQVEATVKTLVAVLDERLFPEDRDDDEPGNP